jgi:hypothetical protein
LAFSGGAIYNDGQSGTSNPILLNCAFQANLASNNGGAMYNLGASGISSPSLTNCSFQANSARNNGGAIRNFGASSGTSSVSLTNCVFFGNGGANTLAASPAVLQPVFQPFTTRYSLFDDSVTGYTSITGNFTTTTSPFATTASIRLAAGSPAIDAGDPATTPATVGNTDLAGNTRLTNGRIDMGAYEFQDEIFTIQTGNWDNPATWNVNRLPQPGDRARLKHTVRIPTGASASCTTLLYDPASKLIYETGGQLRLEQ